MSKRQVVVTGGNGFLGKYCCQALLKKGIEPISVGLGENSLSNVEHHQVNLDDPNAIANFFKKTQPTQLLHLAWYVDHGNFWESPKNLDSLAMTVRLFRNFAEQGGKRFVGVGTCAEYDWSFPSPYSEDSPLKPNSFYGLMKKETAEILSFLANQSKVSFAWARPFYPFGPGEPPKKLIPSIIQALLDEQELGLSSSHQIKDFIYVKDVASALTSLTLSEMTGSINVCTGKAYSIKELVKFVEVALEKTGQWKFGEYKPNKDEPQSLIGSTDRLFTCLGWQPEYSLPEAIEDYIQNFRSAN